MGRGRGTAWIAALAAGLMALGAVSAVAAPDQGGGPVITTVSNPRPQYVSGPEVLVRVAPGRAGGSVRVTADGRDVTSSFAPQADGTLLGLVTGLRPGHTVLAATERGRRASLTVTDHPASGPVFSGPRQLPFFCETTAFGLAPATQPTCAAPTVVSYLYKNTLGAFVALPNPAARPADLATATVHGHAVPYVVRLETGTIDRAVYQIAALDDGTEPSPLRPDTSWNGRLVYTFGGGCNGGYHQGGATGGVVDDLFLAQGYAVASSSLNVLDNNCGTIISAEAAMMVKEHVIDTYGPVAHTIGWGGSGGAIQQYDIADAYPGILDGIIPGVSFPDPLSTLGPVTDCRLLDRFFAGAGAGFTAAQRLAVSGFADYQTCGSWDATFANRITATDSCNAAVPLSARWNPVTNPAGVKCAAVEQYVNQLGRDQATGFVRSPLDNTGEQYGLAALTSGAITPEQFVELNTSVGGFDVTGAPVAARSAADPRALAAAYRDDLVNSASLGLSQTPIIDQRTDLDFAGFGNDIHTTQWSYVMRARLIAANGSAANQVIIENQPTPDQTSAAAAYELSAMDAWLTVLDADHSHRSQRAKVLADKPSGLGDGCYLSAADRVVTSLTDPATGPCARFYPVASDTRLVAGEQLTENALACTLRPIDFAAYPVVFTSDQKARLRATFPSGVCDYRLPGRGAARPAGAWLDYGAGESPHK